MRQHKPKLQMLQPRLKEFDPLKARGIKMAPTIKTLKQKQQANGRTLALNGKAWAALRQIVLNAEPLCRHCRDDYDLIVDATEVDHIDNDPSNNELVNLAPLCHACHSRKTMADMGHKVNYGCDINGWPLDPNHHWNREKSRATEADEPTGSLHARKRSSGV